MSLQYVKDQEQSGASWSLAANGPEAAALVASVTDDPLTVLAELLGGSSQTSVLARELMLTGKALYVGTAYDGLTVDPTTFTIAMTPAPGVSNADAEAALDAALQKFRKDGPDPAQLERVKTQVRAARVYDRDSAHGRAYDYGQGLSVGLRIEVSEVGQVSRVAEPMAVPRSLKALVAEPGPLPIARCPHGALARRHVPSIRRSTCPD